MTLLPNRAFSVEQTREERKMEAIMKAFEKMAKREERRKEALARLDKKHVDVKVIAIISFGRCGLSSFPVVVVDCHHFLWSLWIVISCGHCGLSSFPVVIMDCHFLWSLWPFLLSAQSCSIQILHESAEFLSFAMT